MRTPCPESYLASRNAKILCPKNLIDRDTEFYRRVQVFRSERATKNKSGEVAIKLYIPGRIIHLVDTKGDETKYVPYWDSRYEFNQVILSKRMLADHDILSLPELLRKLNLDDIHEINTWVVKSDEVEHDEPEPSLIVPCSNPQGKIPILLIVLIFIGCTLATVSNRGCKFVSRSAVMYPTDGESSYPVLGLNTGLWNYNLLQCAEGQDCSASTPIDGGNYVDSDYCFPYTQVYHPNTYWVAARIFGTISVLFALVGVIPIATSTCCKLKRRTWLCTCAWFLFVTLSQGLQFLFLKGELCNVWNVPGTMGTVVSQCTISRDGIIGITATIIWFITAVGCSRMARIA